MRRFLVLLAPLIACTLLASGCGGWTWSSPPLSPTIQPRPEPNAAIMATMMCEPVTGKTLDWLRETKGPSSIEPMQVKVGEGNQVGSTWWVVTYQQRDGVTRGYLTDAPTREGTGVWIEVTYYWGAVEWDAALLERGHSALAKVRDCHNQP